MNKEQALYILVECSKQVPLTYAQNEQLRLAVEVLLEAVKDAEKNHSGAV